MSENQDQQSAQAFLQSSELAARLLQRMIASPGLLDLQMLRRRYARLAGWIARSAPLLDELTARYRIDDDAQAGNESLLMEQPRRVNVNAYLTTSSSFSSTINQLGARATNMSPAARTGAHFQAVLPTSASSPSPAAIVPSSRVPGPAARPSGQETAYPSLPAGKFRVSRSPERRAWEAPSAPDRNAGATPVDTRTQASTPGMPPPAHVEQYKGRPTEAAAGQTIKKDRPVTYGDSGAEARHPRVKAENREKDEKDPLASPVDAKTGRAPARPVDTRVGRGEASFSGDLPVSNLPLARAQLARGPIPGKIPDAASKVISPTASVRRIRADPHPVEDRRPAGTPKGSPRSGSSLLPTGEGEQPDGDVRSLPVPSTIAAVPARPTMPTVRTPLAASEIRRQPPNFVWRQSADAPAAHDFRFVPPDVNPSPRTRPIMEEPRAAPPSPSSQSHMPQPGTRKEERPTDSGPTTERILRQLSRQLLIERERRGY